MVWDLATRSKGHDIELVQNSAIQFISNVTEARRKDHHLFLLTRILHKQNQHRTIPRAYDEIIEDRELVTVATWTADRGELISMSARKSMFHTRQFGRCSENRTNNYTTANAVANVNPGSI